MGFYVQDDFWEAMEDQPPKVQDEVLGALTRLFFTGEVAELKGVSKVLFVAFRERVLIARKRSDAGKSKAQSNANQNGNQNSNKTESNTGTNDESKAQSNANQNGNQNSNKPIKSESESEKERKSESLDPDKSRSKVKHFSPPSPAEVSAYAAERHSAIDAERFCDFYASKGWKVGKSPMRDWKAAARNWMRNNHEQPSGKGAMDDETAFYAGLEL